MKNWDPFVFGPAFAMDRIPKHTHKKNIYILKKKKNTQCVRTNKYILLVAQNIQTLNKKTNN